MRSPAGPAGRPRGLPPRLLRWGVDAAYGALSVVLTPYALVRAAKDSKTRSRWRAYLRDVPSRFRRRVPRQGERPCVWVHGVSVGEVKSAARLLERIEEGWPGVEVVVSVSTGTGRRVARDRYAGRRIDFYPPDFSWIVGDALDALRPGLVVLVESGFWPNLLSACRERGVPVVLVNGRVSARSAGRFRRILPIARWMLGSLDRLCVQLPVYAERFRSLGVAADRIHVTGNMKLDNIPSDRQDERARSLLRVLGAGDGRPVVVAGSTHPAEERALARIRRRLGERGLSFRLVVAPRHPERADAAEAEIRKEGLPVVRRSRLAGREPPGPEETVLLDTVGELEGVYSAADAVFVGGTLVPHGGQNMMEPASLGRPVVVGPHLHNFRGEVDLLLDADAIAVVPDEAGVESTLEGWLRDPPRAAALGARARAAILTGKGATERTVAVLAPCLDAIRSWTPPAAVSGRRG